MGWLLIGILALSICLRIPGTRTRLDPRSQDQPAVYAEQFLQDAPQDAIVYTSTDQDSFPLWYYHFGLHETTGFTHCGASANPICVVPGNTCAYLPRSGVPRPL